MAKAQTPQDHEDDAMKNNIRSKFEKMFSDQGPPTYASLREVEAMKAHIHELEAKLEMAEQKTPALVQKMHTQALSSMRARADRVPGIQTSKMSTAALIALFLSVGHFMSALYYVYVGRTSELSQFYTVIAISMALAILFGISSLLSSRKQSSAIHLLVLGAVAAAYPPLTLVVMEAGLVMGLVLMITSVVIALQVLPQRAGWAVAGISVISGLATLLLNRSDLVAWPSLPGIFISLLGIPMMGLLGYFLSWQFRTYPLRTKLITSFLLLTITPLAILGWQTYATTHAILEEQIKAEILRSSMSTSAEFQEFLDSQFATIRYQARATEFVEYISLHPSQREGSEAESRVYDRLKIFRKNKPAYIKSYALLDSKGIDVLDTNKSRIGTSFAEQDFFAKVIVNRGPYASGLVLTPNGDRNIYVAAPIRSKSGDLLGVYLVTYSPDILHIILDGMIRTHRLTPPTTEFTYLIDVNNYFVLGHSTRINLLFKTYLAMGDARLVKLQEQGLINQEELNKLVVSQPEVVRELSKIENTGGFQTPSYTGEITESAAVRLLNSDWIVVTSRPTSTISNLIQSQTRVNVILSIIIIGFVSLFAVLASSFFTAPIIQLTRVAKDIATGNLTRKASIRRNDEIGVLAQTLNSMTDQIQSLISGLEERVADRTRDLELASEVGQTVSQKVSNLHELLSEATDLIRDRFNLYYTQIYLLDLSGRTLVLHAGTGSVGAELMKLGHRLQIGHGSLNGRAAADKKAVIVADTAQSDSFLPNPLLPNTRSEMVVPLIVGGNILGVLDMQSERPGTFKDTNLPAFEALAAQLSIAIQNASLFAEAELARAQIEARTRHETQSGWQEFLNAIERGESVGYAFDQKNIYSITDGAFLQNEAALSIPISVTDAEVGVIQLADEGDRVWSAMEAEIARATASVLGQHIDNLRLLAQAEEYRSKAEQAARRLTREGWESFLKTRNQLESGYLYDLNRVRSLTEHHNGSRTAIVQPIVVQTESMGELAVASEVETSQEAIEIVAAVAAQLSNHIENLRLLEQTQERSLELEETETFLNSVIESLPNMLFVKDAEELRFVRWNKAAEEIVGFSQEQMIGKNDYDFFPKAEADFFTSKDRQVLTEGKSIDIAEETLVTPHRGARLMHTRKAPVYGLDGKPKYLLGVAEDITEQKKAEAALARRATELATVAQVNATASTVLDPDKLLQAVVDLTKERFQLYHAHIYLTNESWNTLLLAAGAGEVGWQMVSDGWNIPIDHEQSIVARAARGKQSVIANDLVRDANSSFLSHQLLPDTRSEMAIPMIVGDKVLGVFDVQSDTVNYFSEEDANIFTTLATQTAIALQNARLYVEQAATLTQLRELDKLKSSFLANMSHELRTPLNSILGFTDVMLEGLDGELTEYMNNDLRLVQKNGQHLLHLINDVLDMAKIESGRMNLHPETFRVHNVLEEVISITSTLANEKNLLLVIDKDSNQDIEIYADNTRLRQVMINLVNNSIKFTEKGEISLSVKSIDGGRVQVTVKDTGIGIPPDKLDAIFQEFTQVDTSTTRKAGGTGLGLPISRRLVEMHGGRLMAFSTGIEGEGSTFFVELPVEARISEVIEKQER